MHEQEISQSGNLPARLPHTMDLLRRTQGTLEVLREVTQESSAKFWYERGKKADAGNSWDEAIFSYWRCIKIAAQREPGLWYESMEKLCLSYAKRAEKNLVEGNVEGHLADQKESDAIEDYLASIADAASQYTD